MEPAKRYFVLSRKVGGELSFQTPQEFADGAFTEIRLIQDVDDLYNFGKRNQGTMAQLRRSALNGDVVVNTIVAEIKARAHVLKRRRKSDASLVRRQENEDGEPGALAFPKERRIRNKDHLQFVAQQPCLICGRRPSHAHHLRFAQRKALGMKVSDEFTVPLCSVHHDAVHRVGNEQGWWIAQAIDPLKVAAQLWGTSIGRPPEDAANQDARSVAPNGAPPSNAASSEGTSDR